MVQAGPQVRDTAASRCAAEPARGRVLSAGYCRLIIIIMQGNKGVAVL